MDVRKIRFLTAAVVLLVGVLALVVGVPMAVAAPTVQEGEPDEALEPRVDNYFCGETEAEHPVVARLVEYSGLTYDEVLTWFCDGYGLGQIGLALYTAEMTEEDPADLLAAREEYGWGEIWQEHGLIGRPHDGDPDEDGEEAGPLDHAGPPAGVGGPPAHAGPPDGVGGPPEHAGPPAGVGGPPEHAGPPDGVGGPPEHAGPPDGVGGPPEHGGPPGGDG